MTDTFKNALMPGRVPFTNSAWSDLESDYQVPEGSIYFHIQLLITDGGFFPSV